MKRDSRLKVKSLAYRRSIARTPGKSRIRIPSNRYGTVAACRSFALGEPGIELIAGSPDIE